MTVCNSTGLDHKAPIGSGTRTWRRAVPSASDSKASLIADNGISALFSFSTGSRPARQSLIIVWMSRCGWAEPMYEPRIRRLFATMLRAGMVIIESGCGSPTAIVAPPRPVAA